MEEDDEFADDDDREIRGQQHESQYYKEHELARKINQSTVLEKIEQKYKDIPSGEDGYLDEEEDE